MRTLIVQINYNQFLRNKRNLVLFDAEELAKLIEATGYQVVGQMEFTLSRFNPGSLLSRDKIEVVQTQARALDCSCVVLNATTTTVQERNLTEVIGVPVRNRNHIILELFSKHAKSADSKLQVKLARLEQSRASLVRSWTHLERQRGKTKTRGGPGETQLESDHRSLDASIFEMRKKIAKIRKRRKLHRDNRNRNNVFKIALVGYTNSGKTSLFNMLCGAGAHVADQWFATLDPLVRRLPLPDMKNGTAVMMDTVGFISQLPAVLKASFSATLEEITQADLLLHVIDSARPGYQDRMTVVQEQLTELSVYGNIPVIEVFNKIDILGESPRSYYDPTQGNYRLYVSAYEKHSSRIMLQNVIANQIPVTVK